MGGAKPLRGAVVPAALVVPDQRILSSYGPGGSTSATLARADLRPLAATGGGRLTADTAAALLALHEAVLAAGGDLRVTDGFRSVAVQRDARARYENWVAAGKPRPGSPGYDSKTMKSAYVAIPGRSFHNAGRAVDLHLAALRFPGIAADRQLDRLWQLAHPIGWRPIISSPVEGASEAWHFDFLGVWARVMTRRGYEETAIAASQDADNGETPGAAYRLQGGLHRAGFDVGAIDGLIGAKTRAGLRAAGYAGDPSQVEAAAAYVDGLPDAATYRA